MKVPVRKPVPISTEECVDKIQNDCKKALKDDGKTKEEKHISYSRQRRESASYRSDPSLGFTNGLDYIDDDKKRERIEDLDEAKAMIRRLSGDSHPARVTATKSHFQLSSTAYGVRMLSKDLSNTKVELEVENLMIVTKTHDVSLIYLTRELVEWLLINFPKITVYVGEELKNSKKFSAEDLCKDSRCENRRIKHWSPKFVDEHDNFFDLIVTLGGDGTVLFVSSVFQRHVPPVLSFSLGSLGFLTNFQFEHFKEDLTAVLNKRIKTNLRMRLDCKAYRRRPPIVDPQTGKKTCVTELVAQHQVLNEVTIDRGPSPFISMLELYGDHSLLTMAQADGLIIATPTGSTAYSLSAGGSLVYPSVNAIAVTPICPHTLSFRPIILPESMVLKVRVSLKSRATAWAAFDGKSRMELKKGDYITIQASPYSFPTVESHATEFIDSISRTLNWNVREQQRSFTHMLSRKNQEKYASDAGNALADDEEVEEVIIDKNKKPPVFRLKDSADEESDNNDDDNDDDDETEEAIEDDVTMTPVSPRSKPVDRRTSQANFTI